MDTMDSYNLPFEKWVVRGNVEKEQKKIKKELIQAEIRRKMGLLVDVVKPGSGSKTMETLPDVFSNP